MESQLVFRFQIGRQYAILATKTYLKGQVAVTPQNIVFFEHNKFWGVHEYSVQR